MAKSKEEKVAAKAEAKVEKEAKEPEEKPASKHKEIVVLEQPGKAKLTRKGDVYSLYNGVGQLLQSGLEKQLKKLYSEFSRYGK